MSDERKAVLSEPRYRLKTYYVGAREPHVMHFDSCSEALDEAAHRHRCHAGIAYTLAEPVKVPA